MLAKPLNTVQLHCILHFSELFGVRLLERWNDRFKPEEWGMEDWKQPAIACVDVSAMEIVIFLTVKIKCNILLMEPIYCVVIF